MHKGYNIELKLVFLGDVCVGKSNLIIRYADDIFN
jgi:GTPase SAR1 family protein